MDGYPMNKPYCDSHISRVIIVSNSCGVGGGASKIAIITANALASHTDYEVWLFCGSSASDSKVELESAGVHVLSMDSTPYQVRSNSITSALVGLYDAHAEKALRELILSGDPSTTIVHFHSWLHSLSPSPFYAAASCGARVCVTAHEYFSVCPNGGFFDYRRLEKCRRKALSPSCLLCNCDKRSYAQKLYRCLRHAIQLRGFREAHASFFSISNLNRALLEEHGVPGGVRGMLVNPIDVKKAGAIPCGMEKDSFYLYVGRIDPEKGVSLLCDASRRAGVSLVVVGDGSLKKNLEEQYPDVRFMGWKSFDEIAGYYAAARAVVIPSLCYETSSLAVLEAKAVGAGPFIVPSESAPSEYVEDGVDGFVFESGDVNSLADALRLLEDEQSLLRLRKKGGAPVGRTVDEYVEKLCEAYASC